MTRADVNNKAINTNHGEAGMTDSSLEQLDLPDLPFVVPAVPDDAPPDMLAAFLPTMKAKERRAYYRLRKEAARRSQGPVQEEGALEWLLQDAGLSARRAWDVAAIVDAHLPGLLASDDLAGLLLTWRRKGTGRMGGQGMLPGLDGPGLPDTRSRQ